MAELMSMSPDITLFHILPRLQVKSLCRFKCVSKEWHSFIRTPGFRKMHIHHQNQHKLLFLPHTSPWYFSTIHCETPEDGRIATRRLPFNVRYGDKVFIATSLHGMVCVLLTNKTGYGHQYPTKVSDILLWNPVTSHYKTLSKAGSHKDCYEYNKARYGLYYCSSEDDYKLVCLTNNPIYVYIYSLKCDSWRMVESTGRRSDHYSYLMKRSVLFNEKIYFGNSYSITTFDTQTKKLRDIKTPHFRNQRTSFVGFMIVRDCLHFLLGIKDSVGRYDRIEQWRMDGNGDWTKVETRSSGDQLYHYDRTRHWMKNENWVMYFSGENHVYVVDAKKHTKGIISSISF